MLIFYQSIWSNQFPIYFYLQPFNSEILFFLETKQKKEKKNEKKKNFRSVHSKNTVPAKLTRRQIGIARLPP